MEKHTYSTESWEWDTLLNSLLELIDPSLYGTLLCFMKLFLLIICTYLLFISASSFYSQLRNEGDVGTSRHEKERKQQDAYTKTHSFITPSLSSL